MSFPSEYTQIDLENIVLVDYDKIQDMITVHENTVKSEIASSVANVTSEVNENQTILEKPIFKVSTR